MTSLAESRKPRLRGASSAHSQARGIFGAFRCSLSSSVLPAHGSAASAHGSRGWPGKEIAYGVSAAFAGKGYAYEAAVAACDFAVEFLGWDELMHCIAPDNFRSQALAKRLGATNQGPTRMPAPYHDHPVDKWAQSAAAWRARRKEQRT